MTALDWVTANFHLLLETSEGFEVCAMNGEQSFITRPDAEAAARRVGEVGDPAGGPY